VTLSFVTRSSASITRRLSARCSRSRGRLNSLRRRTNVPHGLLSAPPNVGMQENNPTHWMTGFRIRDSRLKIAPDATASLNRCRSFAVQSTP